MKMSDARILVLLTLPKKFIKLSDSKALGNLLKLYKVEKMSVKSAEICAMSALLNC